MSFTRLYAVSAAVCLALLAPLSVAAPDDVITISGTWSLALDPDDAGRGVLETGRGQRGDVWLPGSIQQQGYGDTPTAESPWIGNTREREWSRPEYDPYRDDEHFKMPFWLQPERVYVGAAWYERTIEIPEKWTGRRVSVSLERVHWVSEAWLDGEPLGVRESLSTPHIYDLGVVGDGDGEVAPGAHTLTLKIDNRMAYGVGVNAHSMTDHTQSNWNGVIGAMELRADPAVTVARVHVTPDASARSASVLVTIANAADRAHTVELSLRAESVGVPAVSASRSVAVAGRSERMVRVEMDLGEDAALWNEFDPNVYTLHTSIEDESGVDHATTDFGLRDIGTANGRITVNGTPVFLRGTLDCAIYPLTGYAPMDTPAWERVFTRVKEFGLNHVRYHSWCPPRAAFEAADKIGVYLQVEGPFWVNQGTELGRGRPIDGYVYEETDRILAEFGNHPSFVMMAYGNEPSGPGRGGVYLTEWVERYKAQDPRRLYTSASGWPLIEASEYHVGYQPRIQRWGEELDSTINSQPPATERDYTAFIEQYSVPVVAHETGQWCVFPDFAEMSKYTGVLKPKNFEIFRDILAKYGQAEMAERFLMDSGALQVMCYKEEIEAALRTPGFGGFQLLDIHDFPGQGTALVGVLDPFWDPKPYVDAEQFRSFNGPVVPLARLPKRVFESAETFSAQIELAQFGASDLGDAEVSWTLSAETGRELGSGAFRPGDLDTGELHEVGRIELPISVDEPTRATLRVEVEDADAANAWDIWVYPKADAAAVPEGVRVVRTLDDDAEDYLNDGGTVLLMADGRSVDGGVAFGFSPAFWNTAWTDGQAPHTLGITVDPSHPVFASFPTASHTDWQWWDLIGWPGARAGAMVIDALPRGIEPVVRPIDTWFRSRRLASMFECRVGSGKLFVTTMDLDTDLEGRLAARQLREGVMAYLGSDAFEPAVEVEPDLIRGLFREPSLEQRMGARVHGASSAETGYGAELAMDGDPGTMWHSAWSDPSASHPHSITVSMIDPVELTGIAYQARQSGPNGMIDRYEVHVSDDGASWALAASGRFTDSRAPQAVSFGEARRARFVRLTSLSSLGGGRYASVAEIGLRVR